MMWYQTMRAAKRKCPVDYVYAEVFLFLSCIAIAMILDQNVFYSMNRNIKFQQMQ